MGKLSVLLVLAAVLGGTLLTANTRRTINASAAHQSGGQADVLAREIAESAQSLVVTRMMTPGGLTDPGIVGLQPLDGGTFSVAVSDLTPETATVEVQAIYGGAVHTVRNTYRYDRMSAPGPLWFDVPTATGRIESGSPSITGGDVLVDPRRHQEHALDGFLPLSDVVSEIGAMASGSGSSLPAPNAAAWPGDDGLLGDLNVDDTAALYRQALAQFDADAGDQTFGSTTVTTPVTVGGEDNITLVTGDAVIAPGGSVTGSGLLVVDGNLTVESTDAGQGRLDWTGLILVRTDGDVLRLDLKGDVTVRGAIAVVHDTYPPGGHLDISVYQDAAGMDASAPGGAGRGTHWDAAWPWYDHVHAFDLLPKPGSSTELRDTRVEFLDGGAATAYEADVHLAELIAAAGTSTPVYLEFGNPDSHGYAVFDLDVQGRVDVERASVQAGFPSGFQHPDGGTRSAVFQLGDLQTLAIEVQSLRALRQSFDDPSCTVWPFCIGADWNRRGALALRLVRGDDDVRLWETTFYWHMREEEKAAHEAAEEAWRERVSNQTGFGTHVVLGDDVDIQYLHWPIEALAAKMLFDVDKVALVSSSSDHLSATDSKEVCAGGETLLVAPSDLAGHLGTGGVLGRCAGALPKTDDIGLDI